MPEEFAYLRCDFVAHHVNGTTHCRMHPGKTCETFIVFGKLEELMALIGIDLKNAYGEYYRSGAIEEVLEKLPMLAGLVKSELQNGSVSL